MVDSNGLTKKQAIFVKEYNKTGNGTISAIKAYNVNNSKTAQAIASENLSKPLVKARILSIAEQIPDKLLLKVHKEGLKAMQVITKDGVITDKTADYSVRQRYLDTAYKLKGVYAPEKRVSINGFGKLEEMSTEDLLKSIDDSVKEVLE